MKHLPMITIDEWHVAGQHFVRGAQRIFYRREGNGPALLCIHGFPTASWDWQKIWPQLTERFDVVAPDMIGFGFSDKPPSIDYSILDQADIHEELLGHLGVTSCIILAHDYGDTVAQELLARYYDRLDAGEDGLVIEAVCFLNGGLFPELHRPRLVQRLLDSPVGRFIGRAMSREKFGKSFSEVLGPDGQPTKEELDSFWALMEYNDGRAVMHKLIGYMRERRRYRERWVGVLTAPRLAMRLINGPADPVSGRHAAEYYREQVPNADVVILPDGIGHYPQVEAPDAVLEHFLSFVDGLGDA